MQQTRQYLLLTSSQPSPRLFKQFLVTNQTRTRLCHLIAHMQYGCCASACSSATRTKVFCMQGGLAAQPSGNAWGQPGSPGSRPGTAGSLRGSEAPPSPRKLAAFQQTSFNKANSGALSEVRMLTWLLLSANISMCRVALACCWLHMFLNMLDAGH